jgi:hypothetical protein
LIGLSQNRRGVRPAGAKGFAAIPPSDREARTA